MAHRRRTKDLRRMERETELGEVREDSHRRLLLGIAAILVLFVLLAAVVYLPGPPTASSGSPAPGSTAPDFTLTDIDGNTFRLSAARDRPVLLDFMGSRCPTCVQEMPHLGAIRSRFSTSDLIMISVDVGGPLGTTDATIARQFMEANGGTWPIALDSAGVGLRYGVVVLPTIYIIDATGIVAYRNPGVTAEGDLAAQIERLG